MLHKLTGVSPTQVFASQEPSIEPYQAYR